jgi:hypothetical protein
VNSLTVSFHESMGRVIGIGGGHTHVDKELGRWTNYSWRFLRLVTPTRSMLVASPTLTMCGHPEGHSDDLVNSLTVSFHESMGRVIGIGGGHTHVDKVHEVVRMALGIDDEQAIRLVVAAAEGLQMRWIQTVAATLMSTKSLVSPGVRVV